jgi:hypothetical protein
MIDTLTTDTAAVIRGPRLLAVLCLASISAISGCGGGGGGGSAALAAATTPAGTYTVPITLNGTGGVSKPLNVTVVVE